MLKLNVKPPVKASLAFALFSSLLFSSGVSAQIDEFNGPSADQLQVGNVKNERVLLQRLDQRTLITESGKVVVPPMVTLTDTRDPDDWYKPAKAKAVFYFTNDLELTRVVISD